MVAIHSPRRTEESWSDARARPVRPAPTIRLAPPALPDRATRIRRRRLAVLMAAVALAVASVLGVRALGEMAQIDRSPSPEVVDIRSVPVAGQRYVVQPGDTLWSIAATIAPDDDPRAVVDALREANGGPDLQVGDELILQLG